MKVSESTWVDVETYLQSKNSILIPIGSTEQHGPTGLLGTDYLTADAVAQAVAEKLEIAVAPPLCYGMATHHMGFPGSVALRPAIYQEVVSEILRSFYTHGFRRFYFVNGHGGNINSVSTVLQNLKAEGFAGASFAIYNWWKMPEVSALADELYGEGEGFHATPSEISLTYHLIGEKRREISARHREMERKAPPAPNSWPMTVDEIKKYFPTGAMRSNPDLASGEHGKRFFSVAVESIAKAVKNQGYLE